MCTSAFAGNSQPQAPAAPVATRPVIAPESANLGSGIANSGKNTISDYAKRRKAALTIGD